MVEQTLPGLLHRRESKARSRWPLGQLDYLNEQQVRLVVQDVINSSLIDTDGDGVRDIDDAFPLDNTEWLDLRWQGNNADIDDDDDGLSDDEELILGTNPLNADTDGDGTPDAVDPNPTQWDAKENLCGVDYHLKIGSTTSIHSLMILKILNGATAI